MSAATSVSSTRPVNETVQRILAKSALPRQRTLHSTVTVASGSLSIMHMSSTDETSMNTPLDGLHPEPSISL